MERVWTGSLALIVAGVIVLLCLLFPSSRARLGGRPPRGQIVQVVISGPMGNGKTHLWSRLIYGTDRIETVTSMVENRITLHFERQLVLDESQKEDPLSPAVCLVDTPGHPRLSCRSLARNIPQAKALIFVIDSQLGLAGNGLRDTAAALELVLSLLQLLHHQAPQSNLPRLSIHLSKRAPTPAPPGGRRAVIEKTRATLTRELNRRKISSGGHPNAGAGGRKSRLESLDAIPSSEINSFIDLLKRLFRRSQGAALPMGSAGGPAQQLPEEEGDVARLLEEEEDHLAAEQEPTSPLERYESVSGHPLHWTVSGHETENEVKLIKKWMIDL